MNVKYRIISGSIELENKQPLHIDVFPVRNNLKIKYFIHDFLSLFLSNRIV